MKIYVGNLAHDTTESDLQHAFERFGRVDAVSIITDEFSGESAGFGFVEMRHKSEAAEAIYEMDGENLKGNTIRVNLARSGASRKHRDA